MDGSQQAIVAGACNDVVYLRMAVDEVSDQLEQLPQWTQSSVKKAILDALIKVHEAIRVDGEEIIVERRDIEEA